MSPGSQDRTGFGSLTLALTNQGNSPSMGIVKVEWGTRPLKMGRSESWEGRMLDELYVNVTNIDDKALDEEDSEALTKVFAEWGELSKWHKRGRGKSWLECLMRIGTQKWHWEQKNPTIQFLALGHLGCEKINSYHLREQQKRSKILKEQPDFNWDKWISWSKVPYLTVIKVRSELISLAP